MCIGYVANILVRAAGCHSIWAGLRAVNYARYNRLVSPRSGIFEVGLVTLVGVYVREYVFLLNDREGNRCMLDGMQ